jgi:DNA modification methylase
METGHAVRAGDAREAALPAASVELVVTSPPYPMVEMWDDGFRAQSADVDAALEDGDGPAAFAAMHDVLGPVWERVAQALVPGGIACVNVGDATRSVGGEFGLYPNHVEIARRLRAAGLRQLPGVLWRKPVNRATKFMGSGMLPPNAYPTLEHEHVLVFRKGGTRRLPPGDDARYESAYFWEERNRWFSDLWELAGESQAMEVDGEAGRERSGAFPVALPLRLVRMFSVQGDTVWDPFWGTGTTTLAAMLAARSSVGHEIDERLVAGFDDRVEGIAERSAERARERLARHAAWAADREDLAYTARHYEFEVMTKQERRIRPRRVTGLDRTVLPESPLAAATGGYRCEHAPVDF